MTPISQVQAKRLAALGKHLSVKDVDKPAVRELTLFIDNDGELYRQMKDPIEKNLMRKLLKGTYDQRLALLAFNNLATEGAKRYEHGGKMFLNKQGHYTYGTEIPSWLPPTVRVQVAAQLLADFETEAKIKCKEAKKPCKFRPR